MPRVKTTQPTISREKFQRSLDLPEIYFTRQLPPWHVPEWYEADMWRRVVAHQPIATVCMDTLISYIVSLDWKIEPKDSTKRDEYKKEIEYYTKFIDYTGDYDYVDTVEWLLKDYLTLPFGAAAEIGREGDSPDGKVLWIELLDGGTLFPTLNKDWPVGQVLREMPTNPIYFPTHAINRIYMSPLTNIKRKGWGTACPEKIYLALELLNRGDVYYANLLLDTPEAGILDLGDMAKDSAEEWVKSWRSLLGGIDPFKVPVLYEHEKPAQFISFTKSPTELMFDKATMKYAAICAAGYGMSLSDIGIQVASSGGETLAGSIRQERRTRRSGITRGKKKIKSFYDRLLPDYLQLLFIDLDDEASVAIGRARLASATAATALVTAGIFTEEEMRQQTIADGLISISVPEKLPKEAQEKIALNNKPPERPSMLGRPVAPSAGGQGEVRSGTLDDVLRSIQTVEDVRLRKLMRSIIIPISVELSSIVDILEDDQLATWNDWQDEVLWSEKVDEVPDLTIQTIKTAKSELGKIMDTDETWKITLDPKKVSADLVELFREVVTYNLRQKAALAYETGKSDRLQLEFPSDPVLERKFKSRVNKLALNLSGKLPEFIQNSVVSGTRKYLSTLSNAMELDIDSLMVDNTAVQYVRNEIDTMLFAVQNSFAEDVATIMYEVLENKNEQTEKNSE